MLKDFVMAVQSWEDARIILKRPGVFKWIFITGFLYTLLFIAGMMIFWKSSDIVITWFSDRLGVEPWLQKKRNEWLSFFMVMTGVILRLVLFLFYFSFFKYLILIIGAPVFAYLNEKTEAALEGKNEPADWSAVKKNAWRSIRLDLRNCGRQTLYLLALILLAIVPVAGWITPIIAVVLECYYFGFSMLDYSLARAGLSAEDSSTFIGEHNGLAIGHGLLFYLMHIFIILAPSYAVVAAALSIHKYKSAS
ncbi:MAG: EI24 domain-containing protein [Chitinophagaceae bacterium]|nr:EI24 domain-containing protein [Chitinophagaceae bacterium]